MAAFALPIRSRWARVLAIVALVLAALVLLVALFPWDLLRGPVNRFVTHKTGREFQITRHLDVKVGRTTRVIMDGVEFANPDWAQDRHLVKAERAEVEVRLWPLLSRREIVLPSIRLAKPQLGLQEEPDGRRTWALGGDTKDERNVPSIGALHIDQGQVHYVAAARGADIRADVALDPARQQGGPDAGPAMPLRFQAQGRWQGQAFRAEGRTGDVLYLSAPLQNPFPAEVQASTGGTNLQARGSIASLASLEGANVQFRLEGPNLAELYKLIGVALPDTPRYVLAGQLSKQGEVWRVRNADARLGKTDMAGELAFDRSGRLPLLTGKLQSRMLDFEDLAPVIGLDRKQQAEGRPERTRNAQVAAAPAGKERKEKKDKAPRDPGRKVLPDVPLDVSKLKSMDADVQVDAARVVNAKGLPLDSVRTHVVLRNGVLVLDPLNVGVAGGRMAGTLRIDANANPVQAQARLDGQGLALNKQVTGSESLRNSFGQLQAQVDLTARGSSVRQMLGTSNGKIAFLMGRAEMSNLALEIAGLDGGEIIKFFTEGDRRVTVRCAVAAFDVENGLMTSRAVLLDTDDTVFNGAAKVNLATEAMDIYVRPEPKDRSILSLRSPLQVTGTFGNPKAGLDKVAIAKRAAAAIGLGAVNPLLALLATVETGPGRDADCVGTMKQAQAPRAEARVEKVAPPVAGAGGKPQEGQAARTMGAGPATGTPPGERRAAERAPRSEQQPPAAAGTGTQPRAGTPGKPAAP